MTALVGNPQWRLLDADGALVVTAGGDQVFLVDDLPGAVADELAACWSDQPPTLEQLSPNARRAFEELRAIGAIMPGGVPAGPELSVGIRWVGSGVPGFADVVKAELDTRLLASDPQLVLVVRTTGTLRDLIALADDAELQQRPHLLVDLAAHHTIALGPLVIPGFTACLGCFAGRVSRRWGDPEPAPRPGATSPAAALAAAGLALAQVERVASRRFDLADHTMSLDLHTFEARHSAVLRWSGCPSCAHATTTGRVPLPW